MDWSSYWPVKTDRAIKLWKNRIDKMPVTSPACAYVLFLVKRGVEHLAVISLKQWNIERCEGSGPGSKLPEVFYFHSDVVGDHPPSCHSQISVVKFGSVSSVVV